MSGTAVNFTRGRPAASPRAISAASMARQPAASTTSGRRFRTSRRSAAGRPAGSASSPELKSSTNAATVCGGNPVQIGAPETAVYNACGNPTTINQTFINQPVPSSENPEVWTYQIDPYTPPTNLTFVNGVLQSIN